MSMQAFYPYPVAPEGLELSAQSDPDLPLGSDGAYLVYVERPDVLRLQVNAELTADATDFLEAEGLNQYRVSLILRSVQSRRRLALPLDESTGSRAAKVEFKRHDWSGDVGLQAVLTAEQSNGDDGSQGKLVAWSRELRLVFDEPQFPPGSSLKVEWADFSNEPGLDPKHLFALRERDGQPVILLNQAFPEAVAVLESKGTHGPKARVRDATYQMIVHQGWSSLLATALDSLAEADEGATAEEALSEIKGWEERVLRPWAPYLIPESESALDDLYAQIHRPGFVTELLVQRLPDAIQRRFKTYNGFDGLVRDVLR